MITEDGYTVVHWPYGSTSADHDLMVAHWLAGLRQSSNGKAWVYHNGSTQFFAFRDPEDALAFRLLITR